MKMRKIKEGNYLFLTKQHLEKFKKEGPEILDDLNDENDNYVSLFKWKETDDKQDISITKSDSNCQIYYVDNYEKFNESTFPRKDWDKILKDLLIFVNSPFYFFHVIAKDKDILEKFVKEYKEFFDIDYKVSIKTYESTQYHILIHNKAFDDSDIF